MTIVLATSNRGKLKEFQSLCKEKIIVYSDIIDEFEIEETEDTFAGNALLKAKAIYDKLNSKDYIVISDDSGISLPILDGKPGIYSARYAGVNANDKDNMMMVVDNINTLNLQLTSGYYTCAIAIVSKYGEYCVHGWMYGDVINTPKGDNGFGYDPIFIPTGYNNTLAELDKDIKSNISHRAKALTLAKPIIKMLKNY
jgi:XTP/dITP diphosphohydrolase